MPSLNDFLREQTELAEPDVEWLRLLVGDWQLLSDLSFADLVLWVLVPAGWLAGAHVRPTTGAPVFFDDVVGRLAQDVVEEDQRRQMARAADRAEICRDEAPLAAPAAPGAAPAGGSRQESVPVLRAGRVVAVLTRHTNPAAIRTPSRLELTYVECADALAQMVAQGAFPLVDAPTGSRRGAPRVGDGLVRLGPDGVVGYASPNAVSAFHRLGHDLQLDGRSLAEVTTPLLRDRGPVDEGLPLVLTGKASWRVDIEGTGATLSARAIPLVRDGRRTGALLLLRDVTELRRRERELLSKDATIREIHHRVKNNLQTVGALLRLQSRRVTDGEARTALDQAERRVAVIALVHETLSAGHDETVDFGEVAARALSALVEVARPGGSIRTVHDGRFGRLRAEDATALSLVLTELVQNAAEHGFAGRDGQVTVSAERIGEGLPDQDRLRVLVRDDGVGFAAPPTPAASAGDTSAGDTSAGDTSAGDTSAGDTSAGDTSAGDTSAGGVPAGGVPAPGGLGSQIVRALVTELRGTIGWHPRAGGGTEVRLDLRPRPLD
jgi:two-component system, sensor histidine kinase PdtaS